MTLEEIISAAVDKKLDELLFESFNCKDWREVRLQVQRRVEELVCQELKKREPELRAQMNAVIDEFKTTSKMEVTSYLSFKQQKEPSA